MSVQNFNQLAISKVARLTEDSVCLSFAVPEALKQAYRFKPGQYLTLKANIEGEDVVRSYSICSSPGNGQLRVGIKRVQDGVFSNHANDSFAEGELIDVMPPQGNFYVELDETKTKSYMCLAVGSGITPILAIAKSILATEPESRVTLIYGNRNSASMMFREELSFLKNEYLQRFMWVNVMSREDQGADLLSGHIDNKKGYLLQKHGLIDIRTTDEAFICGPESMMAEVSRGFRIEGLEDNQIHYELFASSAEDALQALQKAKQRVEQYGETKTSRVKVVADGRSVEFDLATVGENILDAGMHNGLELPYSCKAGVCSTCKARLLSGEVDMDIAHGLEPHEIEDGLILTCQAHPISEQVTVDFDQR